MNATLVRLYPGINARFVSTRKIKLRKSQKSTARRLRFEGDRRLIYSPPYKYSDSSPTHFGVSDSVIHRIHP